MKWSLKRACLAAEQQAVDFQYKLAELTKEPDQMQRLQFLFDISKFDCQRVTLLEMFECLLGKELPIDPYDGRHADIIIPVGTIISFHAEHGYHQYPLDTPVCVARYKESVRWHRPTMQAMDCHGNMGGSFHIYGTKYLAFYLVHDKEAIARYFIHWPAEVSEMSDYYTVLNSLGALE